jgi:hypothetical protein
MTMALLHRSEELGEALLQRGTNNEGITAMCIAKHKAETCPTDGSDALLAQPGPANLVSARDPERKGQHQSNCPYYRSRIS